MVRSAVEGRGPAGQAAAIAGAMAGWSRWALALHWLAAAARACGLPAQLWRYRELYRDALSAKFMQGPTSEGRRALALLQAALAKLRGAEVRALAGRLRGLAERVWGARQAAAQELERLREFEAIATPAPGDEALEPGELEQQQPLAQAGAGEQQPQAAVPAAGRPQREVYYSSASRKQALVAAASAVSKARGRGHPAAAALAHRGRAPASPGARLAAWLVPLLQSALATPPHRLPGAAVFSCTNATALRCLSGRPREALHAALAESHLFLEAGAEGPAAAPPPPQLGLSAELEDACLAYRLLDQVGACRAAPAPFGAATCLRRSAPAGCWSGGAAAAAAPPRCLLWRLRS